MKLGDIDVLTLGLAFHKAAENMGKVAREKEAVFPQDPTLERARIAVLVLTGIGNVFKAIGKAEQAEKKGTRGLDL